jgi:hypothetical protein
VCAAKTLPVVLCFAPAKAGTLTGRVMDLGTVVSSPSLPWFEEKVLRSVDYIPRAAAVFFEAMPTVLLSPPDHLGAMVIMVKLGSFDTLGSGDMMAASLPSSRTAVPSLLGTSSPSMHGARRDPAA